MFVDVGVQIKLTGQDLDSIIHDLRQENKILQNLRRDNNGSDFVG